MTNSFYILVLFFLTTSALIDVSKAQLPECAQYENTYNDEVHGDNYQQFAIAGPANCTNNVCTEHKTVCMQRCSIQETCTHFYISMNTRLLGDDTVCSIQTGPHSLTTDSHLSHNASHTEPHNVSEVVRYEKCMDSTSDLLCSAFCVEKDKTDSAKPKQKVESVISFDLNVDAAVIDDDFKTTFRNEVALQTKVPVSDISLLKVTTNTPVPSRRLLSTGVSFNMQSDSMGDAEENAKFLTGGGLNNILLVSSNGQIVASNIDVQKRIINDEDPIIPEKSKGLSTVLIVVIIACVLLALGALFFFMRHRKSHKTVEASYCVACDTLSSDPLLAYR